MRVLCATTANDGHFGPLVPFARAVAGAGHEVRVVAPLSFAGAVGKAGLAHEPCADAPPELIGPVMGRLPTLAFEEADDVVVREVFARIDAQAALASETILSLVPEVLDRVSGPVAAERHRFFRFHEPSLPTSGHRLPDWGDPEAPLVYATFGSVTGSLPAFGGVFREALDALADVGARVLMTIGRKVDPAVLGPLPPNARVEQWYPQDAVLEHAAAMLGHGGFGTTMGALAAAVPQVVVPLFSFDQVVNGDHVAAAGAGLTVGRGPTSVEPAAAQVPRLLEDPRYTAAARQVAAALDALPAPADAVPVLTGLVG